MKHMESKGNWEIYYKNTEGRPPRKELIEGVEFITNKDKALDLGAGALQDSEYLLKQGFNKVIAVDSEPSIQGKLDDERLQVVISPFENFDFPTDSFDLVNAQYSLPFTNPQQFERVFTAIKSALKIGGVFVGQLFGNRDGWSQNQSMTFLTKEEVTRLIDDMEIIKFTEDERDGKTASREGKHWHVFNLILRKK
jgi:SAM-dependent methyltransferase